MQINKIEPPNWFVGMNDSSLQLLVYGSDLNSIQFSSDIDSVEIVEEVNSDDNIAIITLNIGKAAKEGEYNLCFKKGDEVVVVKYSLLDKRLYRKREITPADSIYLIMPDRFDVSEKLDGLSDIDISNPNGWHGGNLKTISRRLNYLRQLGITSIWLTPIFKNEGSIEPCGDGDIYPYHGYSITDFYDIDKHFGSFDDYLRLIATAHSKGLKIIKDIVFNHCSIAHIWNKSALLKEWFNHTNPQQCTNYDTTSVFGSYVPKSYKNQTIEGWFTEQMIDLNLRDKHLLKYLTQMTIWWIETTDIDAVRMDTYLYSDYPSMLKWQSHIHKEYPGFPIIAETWISESSYTAKIQNESAKAIADNPLIVMDFAFQKQISNAFTTMDNNAAEILYNHFLYDFMYPYPQQTLVFLDNHDMNRWMFAHPNLEMIKLAMGIILTVPRIPQIYYGTEILLDGAGWKTGDGYMREDFPWNWAEESNNPITRIQRKEMLDYTTTLLNVRKHSQALIKGEMIHFIPKNNIYAYIRKYKNEVILICANLSNARVKFAFNDYAECLSDCTSIIDIMDHKDYTPFINKQLILKNYQILILNIY